MPALRPARRDCRFRSDAPVAPTIRALDQFAIRDCAVATLRFRSPYRSGVVLVECVLLRRVVQLCPSR